MGLSGSATAETVVNDRVLTGAPNLLNLSVPPLRKEAFDVPTTELECDNN